jgi:hypothetical protein
LTPLVCISGRALRYNRRLVDGPRREWFWSGAFTDADGRTVPLLLDHDVYGEQLGCVTLEHRPDDGLWCAGHLRRDAFAAIGDRRQLSVRIDPVYAVTDGDVTRYYACRVIEVSIVASAAFDEQTRFILTAPAESPRTAIA